MKLHNWQLLALSFLLPVLAVSSQAQSPAGPELLLNERLEGIQFPYGAACDSTASCAVVWYDFIELDPEEREWIYGRSVGPHGELRPLKELRFKDFGTDVDLRTDGSGYLLSWSGHDATGEFPSRFQELDSGLNPTSDPIEWEQRPADLAGAGFLSAIRTDPGYAVLWVSAAFPPPPGTCNGCEFDTNLTLLSELGLPLVARISVDGPPLETYDGGGSFAVDSASRVLVAFTRFRPNGSNGDAYFRRFSPWLEPLGPPVRVNQFLADHQTIPEIAVAPSGEFVVAWQSRGQDGDQEGIFARRFGADGEPLGDEFQVNTVTRSAQRSPKVAMDEHGNFVVIWHGFYPDAPNVIAPDFDVKARLFRADGTPVGDEIFLNRVRFNPQEFAQVAFAPNGTFFAAWSSHSQAGSESAEDIYARRFSASPGEELCWWADGVLRCDLGRTGGEPELATWAGWVSGLGGTGTPAGVPLLGDYDGDGREDLCAWQAGQLACDLDHEGRPLEAHQSFGAPGDTPLLGDVDGDGKADLCVRRQRRLLCDTARDGGRAELQMALRTPAGVPLLGDVDGDGRDDACLYRGGAWNCSLWAGGRLRARFGNPATPPSLGDVDGDGRADFCVLAGGALRCDTARNGGQAEWTLPINAPPAATLLLGNLDGL